MKTTILCTAFVWILCMLAACSRGVTDRNGGAAATDRPNIVIIFCDDLGYGDLGVYGHPTIATPHLDRMAAEGQRWTNFYVAASVCTPSRAGLMTGRLPIRSGMCSDRTRVLFPNSKGGLPASEITVAEALKERGYSTAAIGKWHLGHLPPFLPTQHGFDSYFGIPYSNDMDRVADSPQGRKAFEEPKSEYWNVPLMRNNEIVERPADQTTLTQRYTDEAIQVIRNRGKQPFFLYLAHSMPHVPLFRSPEFVGRSRRGLYGDVIEEIDHSVGRVLQTLKDEGIAENTVVFFTSDNGPWLIFGDQGGSAGLLRDGKGCTWEGGMREPFIAWWPKSIKPAVITDIGSTLDLLSTCVTLAGGTPPTDRIMDGFDLSGTLLREEKSPRDHMYFYRGTELFAVRKGPLKAHFITQGAYGPDSRTKTPHETPEVYHLEHDPGEHYNVAANHADEIVRFREMVAAHRATLTEVTNQLDLQ